MRCSSKACRPAKRQVQQLYYGRRNSVNGLRIDGVNDSPERISLSDAITRPDSGVKRPLPQRGRRPVRDRIDQPVTVLPRSLPR